MNKKDLVKAILDAGHNEHNEAELLKFKNAYLEALLDAMGEDELEGTAGSRIKEEYRKAYAARAKATGIKATTATGRATLNNGDVLAKALARLLPTETCEVADHVFNLPVGTTNAKYSHLNAGMARMNAGNRLRAAVKRDDNEITIDTVVSTIDAVIAKRPAPADVK